MGLRFKAARQVRGARHGTDDSACPAKATMTLEPGGRALLVALRTVVSQESRGLRQELEQGRTILEDAVRLLSGSILLCPAGAALPERCSDVVRSLQFEDLLQQLWTASAVRLSRLDALREALDQALVRGVVAAGDAVHARLRELGAAGATNDAAHVEQRSLSAGSVDLF